MVRVIRYHSLHDEKHILFHLNELFCVGTED
jgi:hypothetical protein